MLNKPVTKGQKLDDSTWMRYLEAVTLTHTEAEWWLPGTGAGGLGSYGLMTFSSGRLKSSSNGWQ